MSEVQKSEFFANGFPKGRTYDRSPEVNSVFCFEHLKSIEKIIVEATHKTPVYIPPGLKEAVRSQKERISGLYVIADEASQSLKRKEDWFLRHYASAELLWVEIAMSDLKNAYDNFIKYANTILKNSPKA